MLLSLIAAAPLWRVRRGNICCAAPSGSGRGSEWEEGDRSKVKLGYEGLVPSSDRSTLGGRRSLPLGPNVLHGNPGFGNANLTEPRQDSPVKPTPQHRALVKRIRDDATPRYARIGPTSRPCWCPSGPHDAGGMETHLLQAWYEAQLWKPLERKPSGLCRLGWEFRLGDQAMDLAGCFLRSLWPSTPCCVARHAHER